MLKRLFILCFVFFIGQRLVFPADGFVIDSFSRLDSRVRAAPWVPGPRSPDPYVGHGSTRFPYRFSKNVDRVYWDKQVRLDLSRFHALEFAFSCLSPGDIRSVAFYLRSGNGWYVWIRRIDEPGIQRFRFNMNEAGTEGVPAGLDKITGIRISFSGSGHGYVAAQSLVAVTYPVALVKATGSASDPGERAFAAGVTRRIGKWLSGAGVSHAVITDDDVANGMLRGSRLAVLCYNPVLPERVFRQVEAFVRNGGKLVVFYSSDARLAGLMGVRLGEYTRSESALEWTHFTFAGSAPRGVPHVVYQESRNIRPVLPDSKGAVVIARWNSTDGKPGAPAWTKTRHGLWMSHVLLKDDDENKALMLLAMLGDLLPAVWESAAELYLRSCGRFGPFTDAYDAMSRLKRMAGRNVRTGVESLIKRAQSEFDFMCLSYAEGDYARTVERALSVRRFLVEAFALAQRPVKMNVMGVWDHSGTGLFPGDWTRTCGLLSTNGINAVFPNFAWGGLAHYKSSALPVSFSYRRYGDQLAQCLSAAERSGIAVHAWKVCWNLGSADSGFIADLRKSNRLQVEYGGRSLDWLCPSHPSNISMELAAISELASRPGLKGVHLDYVRFPSTRACVCANCRRAYEQWTGRKVRDWPSAVISGEARESFLTWRREHITAFVRSARDVVKRVNPEVELSAAVYMSAENAKNLGQDWPTWVRGGLLDFVCPMNYTESTEAFNELVRGQRGLAGRRLVSGIGVTASESRLSPEQVIEQIRAVDDAGLKGFILFDLNRTLQNETLPVLRLGITR